MRDERMQHVIGAAIGAAWLALATSRAAAAATDGQAIGEIRAELDRLKAEQAARAADMQRLEERLDALESSNSHAGMLPVTAAAPVVAAESAAPPSRFHFTNDFRLRYEGNYGDEDSNDWQRGALRARLGAEYKVSDWLAVGGRLATGDPDDPNSSDVTLSNFDDDLNISFDQAYARFNIGNLQAWGGKFPVPFAKSELVWDGDVNPQGAGGTFRLPFASGGVVRISGLYFLVDDSVAGSDSSMIGGQLGLDLPLTELLQVELSAAEYNYSLPGVAGADAGDFRSNLIGPDGHYVSDFNLFDVIAGVTYKGWGDRWPVGLRADYVQNTGARTPGDTGYSVELVAGQVKKQGDWRFGYGYAVAEVDAVLAAFSQDNTTIGTNYRQHTLTVDYSLLDNIVLDATLYHYRPYDAAFAGTDDPNDWLDRLRLQFLVNF